MQLELGYGGPDWDFNGAQQRGAGIYYVNLTRRVSAAQQLLS